MRRTVYEVRWRGNAGLFLWALRWRGFCWVYVRQREAVYEGRRCARMHPPSVLRVRGKDGGVQFEARYPRERKK